MEKKITKATFKSFINKNPDNLFIKKESDFDGMVDCVMPAHNVRFVSATKTDQNIEHTLGVIGLWLVGHSDDYYQDYEDDEYTGLHYYNCCGSGTIAIKKC